MNNQACTRLIANTLPRPGTQFKAVCHELGKTGVQAAPNTEAPSDPFSIKDRTIDQVMDRLLEELTW